MPYLLPALPCCAVHHPIELKQSVATLCLLLHALQTVGVVDMNPLTRSLLASSDIGTMFRITALKLLLVVVGAALDSVPKIQAILIVLAVDGIAYFIFYQVRRGHAFEPGVWISPRLRCMCVSVVAAQVPFTKASSCGFDPSDKIAVA